MWTYCVPATVLTTAPPGELGHFHFSRRKSKDSEKSDKLPKIIAGKWLSKDSGRHREDSRSKNLTFIAKT